MSDITINEERVSRLFKYVLLLYLMDLFIYSKINIIRVHDIAALIFVILKLYDGSFIINIKYSKLMFLFITYCFILGTFRFINNELDTRYIFYILKFIVFQICFILMVKEYKNSYWIISKLDIIFTISILYGIVSVIKGNLKYYGIGTIGEISPSASGAIYYGISVISFILLSKYKKNKYLAFSFFGFILTIFTISKTSTLGLILFYISYTCISFMYNLVIKNTKVRIKKLFIVIIVIIILLIIILANIDIDYLGREHILFNKIINRYSKIDSSYDYRVYKSKSQLNQFLENSISKYIFGIGKGAPEFIKNTITLVVDNQFIRTIIENGFMGTIIWLSIIISIFIDLKIEMKLLFISVFISYLLMGMGYEIFVATKSGLMFWFIVGLIYGLDKET